MKLPTLLPGQSYCLPGVLGVSVCPAASWIRGLETLMRAGSKQFSARSGSAAHTPLQKHAPPPTPAPQLPSRRGPAESPTTCQVATESLPSLCTHVGSSPWQVFQDSCSP